MSFYGARHFSLISIDFWIELFAVTFKLIDHCIQTSVATRNEFSPGNPNKFVCSETIIYYGSYRTAFLGWNNPFLGSLILIE